MWNFNFINHFLHEVKSLHHFPFLYRSASTLNSLDGLTHPLTLKSKIIGFCTYRSRFCFWVIFLNVFKCRYPCSSRFFFTLWLFFPFNDCQCQFFPLITAYNYTYERLICLYHSVLSLCEQWLPHMCIAFLGKKT